MKKCLLSLILAVSLCMGLTVPAFAAQAGDTTLTDIHGWQYTLSQPIIGTETVQDVIGGDEFTVLLVPAGTACVSAPMMQQGAGSPHLISTSIRLRWKPARQ